MVTAVTVCRGVDGGGRCQEETHVTKVADPWGGSYLMESLTNELVKGAMQIIDEVGGGRPLSLSL